MPDKRKPVTFTFENTRYEVDASVPSTGLILLPDGRLLRAGGLDDGVPFAVTMIEHVKAREAPVPPPAPTPQ